MAGLLVSPGAFSSADVLTHTPRLSIGADGVMIVSVRYDEPPQCDPPQRVREVARLHTLGLVVIAGEREVFVLTEEEYNQQV